MKQFENLHAKERERETIVKANKAFPIGTHLQKSPPFFLKKEREGSTKKHWPHYTLHPLSPQTLPKKYHSKYFTHPIPKY